MALFSLLIGVLACSTAVIWIKLCTIDPVLLTGLRLLLATLLLSPLALRDFRRHRSEMTWRHLRDSAIPGVVLAMHFIVWIIGARLTPAANGSLIVNLSPVVTPFLLALLMHERVNRHEIVATLLAGCGFAFLLAADYRFSPKHLQGDLVCLGGMFLIALYLVLGRKFRHHPTNWLFVVPLYGVASLTALAAVPFFADPAPIDWGEELPWLLGLTLFPTIIGHSLVLGAMRHFRGQVVSIFCMMQFIFAGVIAWAYLGETPRWAFYPAAALLLAAGYLAVGRRPAEAPEE